MERLLRKMITPNAGLRCTAVNLMSDPYWHHHKGSPNSHSTSYEIIRMFDVIGHGETFVERSASASSSLMLEDVSKIMKTPWLSRSRRGKENIQNPPVLIESLAQAKRQSTGKVKFPHIKSPSKTLLSKSKVPSATSSLHANEHHRLQPFHNQRNVPLHALTPPKRTCLARLPQTRKISAC
jgi:hypothetical protein